MVTATANTAKNTRKFVVYSANLVKWIRRIPPKLKGGPGIIGNIQPKIPTIIKMIAKTSSM
jgi:hypothetical protein